MPCPAPGHDAGMSAFSSSVSGYLVVGCTALIAGGATPASADNLRQAIHPLQSVLPELPGQDDAQAAFTTAATRYRLGVVEAIDIPQGPAPRSTALLAAGKTALKELRYVDAETALASAAAETDVTGARGCKAAEVVDIWINLGWALQRADWKDLTGPLLTIQPESARIAYLRAATLEPDRVLLPRQYPPLVMETWRLVVAEIRARPRGALVVRGTASALGSVNGGPLKPLPIAVPDVAYGSHLIRVEDPGRQIWAQVVPLSEPTLEIDVAAQPAFTLDDALAADRARRQGAGFALVSELRPGAPSQLQLRLIDAATGARQDATSVPFPSDPAALEAAVMRFDELARKTLMERNATTPGPGLATNAAASPPRLVLDTIAPSVSVPPTFGSDPGAWARTRWPLLTAVGVTLGTALILGIVVAVDSGR